MCCNKMQLVIECLERFNKLLQIAISVHYSFNTIIFSNSNGPLNAGPTVGKGLCHPFHHSLSYLEDADEIVSPPTVTKVGFDRTNPVLKDACLIPLAHRPSFLATSCPIFESLKRPGFLVKIGAFYCPIFDPTQYYPSSQL